MTTPEPTAAERDEPAADRIADAVLVRHATEADIARQVLILGEDPKILGMWADTCNPRPVTVADHFRALAEKLSRPSARRRDVEEAVVRRKAIERFALELVGELTEIQGHEMRLDGKTWLVTTEADIADWLARHIHCEDGEAPAEDADGNPQEVCLCGVGFSGQTWREASEAMDQHRAEMRATYIKAAKSKTP